MKERNYSFFNNNLEILIKKKQHFECMFYPFGIFLPQDNPIFILKLFIISFYIRFPFIKTKPKDQKNIIQFGISFRDEKYIHVFPDYMYLGFYKWYKFIDMPWKQQQSDKYYECKVARQIHLKDGLQNQKTKDNLKYFKHVLIKEHNILVFYYKIHKIYKYKLFNKFYNYDLNHVEEMIIEYDDPITNENIIYNKEINKNDNIEDKFIEWCQENKLKVL